MSCKNLSAFGQSLTSILSFKWFIGTLWCLQYCYTAVHWTDRAIW